MVYVRLHHFDPEYFHIDGMVWHFHIHNDNFKKWDNEFNDPNFRLK